MNTISKNQISKSSHFFEVMEKYSKTNRLQEFEIFNGLNKKSLPYVSEVIGDFISYVQAFNLGISQSDLFQIQNLCDFFI